MAPPTFPAHDLSGDDDNDDDPVTAEYDVYITSPLISALYLLQFPTREREAPYNAESGNIPLELRIKPSSGFLEMDVPLNATFHHDKDKAQTWGSALAKAKAEGSNGQGIAAGFAYTSGMRSAPSRNSARVLGKEDEQPEHEGEGMTHQTLGGQIIKEEKGRPNYMIGAFRGSELHLTPITGLIQMRPQFHHIDAKTQIDRNRLRQTREATDPTPRQIEARIVQMISKQAIDSTSDAYDAAASADTTKEFLQKAQEEAWTRLRFKDEEDSEAYDAYHEHLFLNDTRGAEKLESNLDDREYLDAISAPRLDPSGKHIVRQMARTLKQRRSSLVGGEDGDSAGEDEDGDGEGAGGVSAANVGDAEIPVRGDEAMETDT